MSSPPRKSLLRPLTSKSKTPGRRERNDRFIPNRGGTDIENAGLLEQLDTCGSEFQTELAKQLSVGDHRILSFQSSKPKAPEGHKPEGNNHGTISALKSYRYIATSADRVLDAPEMVDDFYLNVLDWGSGNKLAVGLGQTLYIWDGEDASVEEFVYYEDPPHQICSVKWTTSGTHLAIGLSNNTIELYDAKKKKLLRILRGHPGRVNALSWNDTLTSGGKGGMIMNSDMRQKNHAVSMVQGHRGEICGLSWSDSTNHLASGGGDNLLAVWDLRQLSDPMHSFTDHNAAVKALAWSPHQRKLLASGGGAADHHVRVWDIRTGTQVVSIDAKSQVSSLIWNPYDKELIGGLGASQFQLRMWRWPSLNQITELHGHKERVLHMTLSPDGTTVCSFFETLGSTEQAEGAKHAPEPQYPLDA